MNPIVQSLLNALIKYLESHPEEVQKIVNYAVDALVKWIISQQKTA